MARRSGRWVDNARIVERMAKWAKGGWHLSGEGASHLLILVTLTLLASPDAALAQTEAKPPTAAPDRLRDRGEGLATSMFGTYVRRGELLVYPFFEYYRDHNFEYTPSELGVIGEEDYPGRYRASEGLLFFAYGFTDNLAVEFEAAVISASLDKSPADPSALPLRIEESGLGDIEGQIRWRWNRETDRRPEIFSYGEVVVPHNRDKVLIGTPGWELKYGMGIIRGLRWGTMTARAAVEYRRGIVEPLRPWGIRGRVLAEALTTMAGLRGPRRNAGRAVAHRRGSVARDPERRRQDQQRRWAHAEGDRLGARSGSGLLIWSKVIDGDPWRR